jgi:hypothetical protein
MAAYSNVGKRRLTLAAEPIDALLPRDQATLCGGIQLVPRRPREVSPMWALRIFADLPSRHLSIFPALQTVRQGPLSLPCLRALF